MTSATLYQKLNRYQLEPLFTGDGKKWCQNCYVCNKQINYLKDPSGYKWIRVDPLVRHRKCSPSEVLGSLR